MFTLREIAVSLSSFVLVYCVLSTMAVAGWRLSGLCSPRFNCKSPALLFALRTLPLAAALAATFGVVVPSFQLFEPRAANEGTGVMPLVLGIFALLLLSVGCARVLAALSGTSKLVARWSHNAKAFPAPQSFTVLSSPDAPPLTLVGVHKPVVLVSEAAMRVLSDDELRVALAHEHAHLRSRDNFKKLIFRFCPFPGIRPLEQAWSQSAELAADDSAVSTPEEAVSLASALIKLSRLVSAEPSLVCTVGFVTGPVQARVARLLAWEKAETTAHTRTRMWLLAPALSALVFVFAAYGPALRLAHEATEWLVR